MERFFIFRHSLFIFRNQFLFKEIKDNIVIPLSLEESVPLAGNQHKGGIMAVFEQSVIKIIGKLRCHRLIGIAMHKEIGRLSVFHIENRADFHGHFGRFPSRLAEHLDKETVLCLILQAFITLLLPRHQSQPDPKLPCPLLYLRTHIGSHMRHIATAVPVTDRSYIAAKFLPSAGSLQSGIAIGCSHQGGQLASLLDDDYLIHYMVDFESRGSLLNVEAFSNPFAYTLKITEKNECRERGIDLCETFNYLIGLRVSWQSAVSYYLSKPAEAPAYEGAVDLVCDIGGQYAFRQIEGVLPDGRRALVIWRTVTEDIIASNAALDAYFTTYRKHAQDRAFEVIFVNGDSNLENLRRGNEAWRVQITEIEFKRRMFGEV